MKYLIIDGALWRFSARGYANLINDVVEGDDLRPADWGHKIGSKNDLVNIDGWQRQQFIDAHRDVRHGRIK